MGTEARSTCWGKERWLKPFTFVPTSVTLTGLRGEVQKPWKENAKRKACDHFDREAVLESRAARDSGGLSGLSMAPLKARKDL